MAINSHAAKSLYYGTQLSKHLKDPKTRGGILNIFKFSSYLFSFMGLGFFFYGMNLLLWKNDKDIQQIAVTSIKLFFIWYGIITVIANIGVIIIIFKAFIV